MFIIEKHVRAEVEYRDVLNKGRKLKEPTVNWSSIGSVSVTEARKFANRVLRVCDKVESITLEEREEEL